MFNVRVPLKNADEVFLMNTFTDAQLVVSEDVAELLERTRSRRHDEGSEPARTRKSGSARRARRERLHRRKPDGTKSGLETFFRDVREGTEQLRVTVLTTLQCNFACDYCFQGDHGDYNKFAEDVARDGRGSRVGESELDALHPERFVLTFFGGEPLLNLPVMLLPRRAAVGACQARGVRMLINVITNGLLLTPEVVDRLRPTG